MTNESSSETMRSKPEPSIDLGYPTPAYGGIPSFQNVEEEAEFWDTHSILDFPDAIESISVVSSNNRKVAPISIWRSERERSQLKVEAEKMGIARRRWRGFGSRKNWLVSNARCRDHGHALVAVSSAARACE